MVSTSKSSKVLTRNKENVFRHRSRPSQQGKDHQAPRPHVPQLQRITQTKLDGDGRDRQTELGLRPLPQPTRGLMSSRSKGFPPTPYDLSGQGSSSHSGESSDTSSIFDGFSFEDDVIHDIPSMIQTGKPRYGKAPSRPNYFSDFYKTPHTTRITPKSENGNRQDMYRHQDYGTSNQSNRLLNSTDQQTGRVTPLRTSGFFAFERQGNETTQSPATFQRLLALLDPSAWLSSGILFEEDGTPFFDDDSHCSAAGILRTLLYNPVYPEFTSLQQFCWAVLIGILMGFYTAAWKSLIEYCVMFVWKDLPEKLLEWGVFTSLDGRFPIYHYMWICPCVMGGVLSYISASLRNPIPGQNEWIHSLHSRGIQDYDTFGHIFVLSTAGMASGLSLGPELPLILTAGMIGSMLAVLCKQSMLQARVLNLTAASAAIGGFFGFPMAGALFVLEVPHRMGLQYFEALSPATIASIVAVLTNRLVTGNDVTGYYEYPFLNESLPSEIFTSAIIFGLFGGGVGIVYAKVVTDLKHRIHQTFHSKDTAHQIEDLPQSNSEARISEGLPLLKTEVESQDAGEATEGLGCKNDERSQLRAAASGALAGVLVGVTCMFIPHALFWGEAQLQTLIDKGRTPLPVFGRNNEPSAGLVALGYCVATNGASENGNVGGQFSLGCSTAIASAKIFVTGLSLGTGIIGGHFWGPLFVGCAASHFFTDLVAIISKTIGITTNLSAYPCVALLCIMGSTHVVTFRAHIAIILILTLTIDAFNPEGGTSAGIKVAGDYSAVFPLLTVAVFVACQISRHTIFYEKQRSRGDIMASPEVLCEPGKEGSPLVIDYEGHCHDGGVVDDSFEEETSTDVEDRGSPISRRDIEADFEARRNLFGITNRSSPESLSGRAPSPLPPRPNERVPRTPYSIERRTQNIRSLDTLLDERSGDSRDLRAFDGFFDGRLQQFESEKKIHRRTKSMPIATEILGNRKGSWNRKSENGGHQRRPSLKRVESFGQVDQEQPSLLDQARRRCASYATAETNQKRKQSSATPVRKNSH